MDGPKNIKRDAMPRVVAWLVGAWVVALGLCVMAGSAWGAPHVGRTVVKPLPLTIDRPDMVLLTIGDSQTAGRYQVPVSGTAEIQSDTSIASAITVPFVYPNRYGVRLTDNDQYFNTEDPFDGGDIKPSARMYSKVRYYVQSHEWTARLAHLIGTNYWYSITWDGTGITDCWGIGSAANDYALGGENWGWDNVAAQSADLVIIKLGINDANTGQCDTAVAIIESYQRLIDKLYDINSDVKILLLGIQPFGASSNHGSRPATIARADSLESWITGRAPYYADSSGLKQSALGIYAAKAASGQFSTYSYAYRFVNYNPASADTAISACTDTTITKFHDGYYLHFNWRGEQLHAQHMARDVFGATLPDGADTTDVGDWPTSLFTREAKTVYVNADTGDNYGNWLAPFAASRPMSTINGGIWRAGPGATVEFAAGNYGTEWWTMGGGQYFRPSVYQRGEEDRITLDGNGVAVARIGTGNNSGFSLAPSTLDMPDSLHRFYYTFKGWRFVGYGGMNFFDMDNTTGLRFEECVFDSMGTVYISTQSGVPNIESPITLSFDNCDINGWGLGTTSLPGVYLTGSAAKYPLKLDVTNSRITDPGTWASAARTRGPFRIVQSGADTVATSAEVNLVGNDIFIQDMGHARLLETQNSRTRILNNKLRFGPGCLAATQQVFTNQTGTGYGDTLWFVNNILSFDTTRTITDIGTWPSDAEWYERNLYKSTITLTATAANRGTAFTAASVPALSDTVIFGGAKSFGKSGWPALTLADFGITHGTNHASIGPTQYTGAPILWTGNYPGRASYQDMTPWKLLKLINEGVLSASDSLDADTWYEIPRVYNESDKAVVRSWLDAWENWPNATRMKIRLKFSSSPMAVLSPSDSTYAAGPWGALEHIVSGGGTVSDSLSAATWYQFTRPYNHTDELQIDYWLRVWKQWPDSTRKKIRYRVQGTDLSLRAPTGQSIEGIWYVDDQITHGEEAASDSLNPDTWYLLPRTRDKDFAQATQARIYLDALATWPDAKRKRIRVRTK